MNIPGKIEKLIEQRIKYAWSIMRADSKLADWLEGNEIDVEECDIRGGCEMYVNPGAAASRIREAIVNHYTDI